MMLLSYFFTSLIYTYGSCQRRRPYHLIGVVEMSLLLNKNLLNQLPHIHINPHHLIVHIYLNHYLAREAMHRLEEAEHLG